MVDKTILDEFILAENEEQRAITYLLDAMPRRIDENQILEPFYTASPWPKTTSGNTFPSLDELTT